MAKLHKDSSRATKLYLSVEIGVFIRAVTLFWNKARDLMALAKLAIIFFGRDGLRAVPSFDFSSRLV